MKRSIPDLVGVAIVLTHRFLSTARLRGSLVAAAVMLAAHAAPASAQVVLNPGVISGAIDVAGETVDEAFVSASWTDPATQAVYGAKTHIIGGGSYSLTVNVPSGTTPNYVVDAFAFLNGHSQYIHFIQNITVAVANDTSTADFVLSSPAVITGQVTAASGTLAGGRVYRPSSDPLDPSNVEYATISAADGHYRFVLAVPDNTTLTVTLKGSAFDAFGSALLDERNIDVVAGQFVDHVDWSVPLASAPPSGSIAGTITLNGPVSPTALSLDASLDPTAPPVRSTSLPANGPYTLAPLYDGSYILSSRASFGNASLVFPTHIATVAGGATTTQDVSASEAFVTGTLTLTGTKTLADVSAASLDFTGLAGNALNAAARTWLTPPGGAYSSVVTDGIWLSTGQPAGLGLNFSSVNPGGINESLSLLDRDINNLLFLSPGQTVTRNLTYATGNVSISFTALGGALFSAPYLEVLSGPDQRCVRNNDSTMLPLSTYSFNSSNSSLTDVTTGAVTFVGMTGHCRVTAWATVNGSTTSFGTVEVDVPSVAVTFPEAGHLTSASSITVTGTATALATGIATVVVNGVTADLASSGNPIDMNEVAFSATIPLAKGPNTILTVATPNDDGTGTVKTASDSRVVYSDDGPPAIVWTPADNSTSATPNVTVTGTATDDTGIQTITINGVPVAFTATGGPQHQVSFSQPLTLAIAPGDNDITVVATDLSGQSTTQTHKVTVSGSTDTVPPVFLVVDITVNATTPAGATVGYSFTATDDVDITVPVFCSPVGGSFFAIGMTPVQCTATDAAGNVAAHSFNVTVLDVAPVAANDSFSGAANASLTAGGSGVLANDTDGNGDPLSAVLVVGPAHGTLTPIANGSFTYTPALNFSGTDSFTYRASDGSLISNIATVTLSIAAPTVCSGDDDKDDKKHPNRDDCPGAPIARNDFYTVNHDATLTVPVTGVLANDGPGAVAAVRMAGPSHGTLTLSANGGFVYKPVAGFSGTDTFTYAAKNAAGAVGPTAVVTIRVKPNLPPDADNDVYSTGKNTNLTVGGSGVLADDSDPNGDSLTALFVSGPSHGTLTLNANGSFVYRPAHNFTGTDTFTYKAKDPGGLTDTATVTIRVGSQGGHDDDDDRDHGSKHHDGDHCDHESHRGGHYDGDGCEHDRRRY